MEVSSFDLEHFSVSLHKKQARRQYGDRCGRSRSPSRSDGGDPAASSYGEPPDAISQKIQAHVFCTQKRLILLDETRIGAHQNRLKIFNRKRIELDPDWKAPLQFRNQIARFGKMKSAAGDKQDMIGFDHSV